MQIYDTHTLPQMMPHLRVYTDEIHKELGLPDSEDFGHRRVAHVVQSLGQMGVSFQNVTPLIRRCMMHADSICDTFDLTCAPSSC